MSDVSPLAPGFQAAIFDMDGLMVDSEPLQHRAFNYYLTPRVGAALTDDEFRAMVGIHELENWRFVQERFGLTGPVDVMMRERNEIYEALLREHVTPMPGLRDLVARLRAARYRLAVASSSPLEQIRLVVEALGLEGELDAYASGWEVARSKPDPAVMLVAAARLGVPPSACVVFEDSSAGLTAARAAGMVAVGVPNVYTAQQDLSAAHVVVASLQDVTPELLVKLAASRKGP